MTFFFPFHRRVPLPGGLGAPPLSQSETSHEPRIEDGKLRYEKRFYHRGQPVFVTDKDVPRFAANIHNIGPDAVSPLFYYIDKNFGSVTVGPDSDSE